VQLKSNPNATVPDQPGFTVMRVPALPTSEPAPEAPLPWIPDSEKSAYDTETAEQQQGPSSSQAANVASQQGQASSSSGGLSVGVIVGIVIGSLVAAILLALIVFLVVRRVFRRSPTNVSEGTVSIGKGARSYSKFEDQATSPVQVQAVARPDL
jgi:predicted lipid-binding transport protein (Tim44 family)